MKLVLILGISLQRTFPPKGWGGGVLEGRGRRVGRIEGRIGEGWGKHERQGSGGWGGLAGWGGRIEGWEGWRDRLGVRVGRVGGKDWGEG